jgi:hypothetical protein
MTFTRAFDAFAMRQSCVAMRQSCVARRQLYSEPSLSEPLLF